MKLGSILQWRLLLLVLAAGLAPALGTAPPASASQPLAAGAVFTETNTAPNYVKIFNRSADGTLAPAGEVATGGNGQPTGNPPLGLPYLQTNYEVVLGADGADKQCLFAVNAGSNTISSFAVQPGGLTLVGQASSNGSHPVSLTSSRHGVGNLVLYVLNSNLNTPDVFSATSGSASIQGYSVAVGCALTPIAGSHHLTTSQTSSPTTIAFNPSGTALAVAEPNTNGGGTPGGDIDVFPVDNSGVAGNPVVTVSPPEAPNPYGMAWDGRGHLTVTNWFFVNPFGGTVTSYRLASDYSLVPINTLPAPGHPCWNAITKNDRFLYTTQPAGLVIGTPQILGFAIGHDGTLAPTGTGQTTPFNAVDDTISNDGRYLYVLSDGLLPFITASAISEFSIDQQSGQLTWVGEVDLPGNATSGIAAW
jgi:6-phosphogluconolactonase (cycloisomerase 2 family)